MAKYLVAIFLIVQFSFRWKQPESYAEIEPFRTAITVKFARDWQFAVYAAGLLSIGLFVERPNCGSFAPWAEPWPC